MSEEEKKALDNLRLNSTNVGFSIYDGTTCLLNIRDIQIALNLIEKQQKEIEEYDRTFDIWDERKYRKKYLEERRKEQPNLMYPDADEIYERYYQQKAEIEKRDKIINEMAKAIYRMDAVSEYGFNKEDIIEYFTNKVEKGE